MRDLALTLFFLLVKLIDSLKKIFLHELSTTFIIREKIIAIMNGNIVSIKNQVASFVKNVQADFHAERLLMTQSFGSKLIQKKQQLQMFQRHTQGSSAARGHNSQVGAALRHEPACAGRYTSPIHVNGAESDVLFCWQHGRRAAENSHVGVIDVRYYCHFLTANFNFTQMNVIIRDPLICNALCIIVTELFSDVLGHRHELAASANYKQSHQNKSNQMLHFQLIIASKMECSIQRARATYC